MKNGEEKAKPRRWRPRFSLRTSLIMVTLVAAYFGAWEATKHFGVPHASATLRREDRAVDVHVFESWSTIPLVIGCDAQFDEMNNVDGRRRSVNRWTECNYYLWLFGPVVKLPIDSDSAHTVSFSSGFGGGGEMQ